MKYACASYVRVVSKQQLLVSNFDDTGPFFNKIVKASTIYLLSSLISRYLLVATGIGEIKAMEYSFIQLGFLCERSPSKYVLCKYPEIKIEDAVRTGRTIDVIESYT